MVKNFGESAIVKHWQKNFGEFMLKNYYKELNYILVKLCKVKIVIGRLPHVKKMMTQWI